MKGQVEETPEVAKRPMVILDQRSIAQLEQSVRTNIICSFYNGRVAKNNVFAERNP